MTQRKFETRGDATPAEDTFLTEQDKEMDSIIGASPDYSENSNDMKEIWNKYGSATVLPSR